MNTLLYQNINYELATRIVILAVGFFSLYLGWYALERLWKIRPRRVPKKQQHIQLGWDQNEHTPLEVIEETSHKRFRPWAGVKAVKRNLQILLARIYLLFAPRRFKLIFSLAVVSLLWLSYISHFYFTRPYVAYTSLTAETPWYDQTQPLTITFDKPVNIAKLTFNISPLVPLNYEWVPAFPELPVLDIYRSVRVYPAQTIQPDEQLFVYVVGIESLTGSDGLHEHNIALLNAATPEITATSIAEGSKDIGTNPIIDVDLSSETGLFVDWQAVANPEAEIAVSVISTRKLRLEFVQPLKQSTEYNLDIQRAQVEKAIPSQTLLSKSEFKSAFKLNFTTVKAPLLQSFVPTGSGVKTSTNIDIDFDLDMDRASVEAGLVIEPPIAGSLEWINDRKLTFNPAAALPFDTKYKVTLKSSARSVMGGVLGQDIVKEFRTLGTVFVSRFSPGDRTRNVERNTAITVSFDQEVDKSSAQKALQFSPSMTGTYAWNGNNLTFRPQNMQYGRSYTITVAAGVKSLHGRDSDKSYSSTFTSAPEIFELNVPRYYQGSGTYHCNLVAAQMVLAYRGVQRSVSQLISGVGSGVPYNGSTGGNPNADWVDNYGVNWGPVASYIQGYRSAAVRQNWNLTAMLEEVKKGNPSIIWTQNGVSTWTAKNWTITPGGGTFYGLNGMHSLVVIGYEGPVSNPSYVIVNNPWGGRQRYTRAAFDSRWASSFNRTAVVVY